MDEENRLNDLDNYLYQLDIGENAENSGTDFSENNEEDIVDVLFAIETKNSSELIDNNPSSKGMENSYFPNSNYQNSATDSQLENLSLLRR
jgi:hypothetical protein